MINERMSVEFLKELDNLYYNNGTPEISDTEYDILKETLKSIYPNDPYFNEVGSKVSGNKIILPFKMGSLSKKKLDTVEKWIEEINDDIVVSEKLDGSSILSVWNYDKLSLSATRGDGNEGQDITTKAYHFIPSIKKNFPEISLRGEMLLFGDSYEKLGFKNNRNGVAGLIARDDINIDNLKMINPIFYEVIKPTFESNDEVQRLMLISRLGLRTPKWTIIKKEDQKDNIKEKLIEILRQWKEDSPYSIDGLVLTKRISERENVLIPSNKVAFKVNEDAIRVKCTKVVWETARTGKIAPTIYIDPVDINGSTIQKTYGFNYKFIKDNNIGEGCVFGLVKSGDIIPYITEVFEPSTKVKIPNECSCNNPLTISGVELMCTNPRCPAIVIKTISHYFRTLGCEFISDKTIENLEVYTIEECYDLTPESIAEVEGMGLKRGNQIVNEIQKTLTTTPDKLLASFGIPNIGRTLSKPIMNKYSFPEIFDLTTLEIDGIGPLINQKFSSNIKNYKPLYDFLIGRGLTFKVNENKLLGKKFAITGSLPEKRDVVQKMIESKGGEFGGISSKTNYLINGDNKGELTGKLLKAQENGTSIISWEDFLKMLD